MPKLDGFTSLQKKLRGMAAKAADANVVVVVGFCQKYALSVHENMDAYHPVGQAKYLEQPARALQGELGAMIKTVYARTGSMRDALLLAGLRLQRAAQELVPVDTSALKASAYTAEESQADAISIAAFNRSEGIRLAGSRSK